jgi:hypothetical protein
LLSLFTSSITGNDIDISAFSNIYCKLLFLCSVQFIFNPLKTKRICFI